MNIRIRTIFLLIFAMLLLRVCSLGLYALYDTTEARYAGIGMRMALSQDYTTPMIEPNRPFLAKPPLSFWVTAISFKIFGFNEFGARFPHFLISVALLAALFFLMQKFYDTQFAAIFTLVFTSTIGFITVSGMVMTEASLIASTTLCLISFWLLLEKNASKNWNYVFFVSFGISMLIKGPVGIVLTSIPMVIYLTVFRQWLNFFKTFWIFRGITIFLLISLPWYVIAEMHNPGFFEYFFIGEHIKRFLVPSWKGDLYGHAHEEPFGMIWLFSTVLMLPWVLYPISAFIKWLFGRKYTKFVVSRENSYFLICAIIPLLFFTFARNIIPSYAMFVFYPLSFLIAKLIIHHKSKGVSIIISSLFTFVITFTVLILCLTGNFTKYSDKYLIKTALQNGAKQIYYVDDAPYSARFYSRDAITIISLSEIVLLPQNSFVVINNFPENSGVQKIFCKENSTHCLYKIL